MPENMEIWNDIAHLRGSELCKHYLVVEGDYDE